jgi:hypothetical protein
MSATGPETGSPTSRRALVIVIAAIVVVIGIVVAIFAINGGTGGLGKVGAATPSPTDYFGTPTSTATTGPHQTTGGQTPPPASPAATFGATSSTQTGLNVKVGSLTSVNGVAHGVGEISGPAIKFTVTVKNPTSAAISLSSVVLNLYSGADKNPTVQLSHSGGTNLPASVAPGATVTGVYVFTVPSDQRNLIQITFDYKAGAPMLVFQGAGPAA